MTSLRFALPSVLGLSLFLTLATAGCYGEVHLGGTDGGVADGGGGEPCGPVTCGAGTVCCNSSCGICTGPGEACPAIACTTECHSNFECGPGDYCAFPEGACPDCGLPEGCPELPAPGVCVPRPSGCDTSFEPVCGCDGVTYSNPCDAAAAGATVASRGECGLPPLCSEQDAHGDGECASFAFVRWNGESCVAEGGCGCVGADCAQTYRLDGVALCETDHRGCRACGAMDAVGEGPCDAIFGYAWSGTACVGITGCDCVGADCGSLLDFMTCEVAFDHCGPTSACVADVDCDPSRFCHHAVGVCGGVGECRARGAATACSFEGLPVCGCDGVNYACEAMADAAGASILHEGACATTGPCDAQDARGEGPCAAFFGYAWDGARCIGLSGCSCVGGDCGSTFGSLAECDIAHRGCESPPGGTCGGFGGFVCRPDELCDFTEPHYCGGADETGICMPRPTACADILDPACGCDGVTYPNPCYANAAGVDTASDPSLCAGVPPSP